MTPAIWFSDLHIDDYKPFSFNRDRLEDCLLVLDDVFKVANKRGAKIVLCSGDFFNTQKYLYTKVINRTLERLTRLFNNNPMIVIYAITGQHEFATKNLLHKACVSALEHLATAFPKNFKIIDNTFVVPYDLQPDGRLKFASNNVMLAGIPNFEFKEHFQTRLESLAGEVKDFKAKNPKLKVTLMIHQSPEGQHNPNVRTQVSPSNPLFDVFDIVLCGDIHTSQIITDKFILGGNPLHKELGDEGKEKGIWYLDLEDPVNTLKFISRKGRYPEFIRAVRGEAVVDDADNFIIQAPDVLKNISQEKQSASMEEFGSTLTHAELMTNFYNTVHGKDEKLLKTGLSFLPK